MKSILLALFGNMIIPLLKLISLFTKFKFCHLHSKRIGHQTINFDIALLQKEKNNFLLCSHDKEIANVYILNFFKKQKDVLFFSFFKYFYFAIQHVSPYSKLIVSWSQYQPKFSFHLKNNSKIIFPNNSKEKLEKILQKYKINNEFVGLHSRNNLYLKKKKIKDTNFHNFRNFDFNDYELVIDYLTKKNISVIKLGETYVEENINSTNSKIFTSLDFNSDHEIDYLLNAYAKYNMIGNSGVSGISSILRKKIVYINLIPLNLDNLSYCSPGSIILPKKVFNKEQQKFLTFRENTAIDFSIHQTIDPYEKNNLSVINNSPKEILQVMIEMENSLSLKEDIETKKLNDLFWKSIAKNNHEKINYLQNVLKLSISSNFLKNNQNLF